MKEWVLLGPIASTICTTGKTLLSSGVPNAFAQLLKILINARFKSRREFVRATKADNEDSVQGYLTKVIRGEKPPPVERLQDWADALELYGDDRQRFLDLAYVAWLPPVAQPRFISLLSELQSSKTALRDIYSRLDSFEGGRDGIGKKQ